MHVGRKNPRFAYTMESQTLDTVDSEKDLGITISYDLKIWKFVEMHSLNENPHNSVTLLRIPQILIPNPARSRPQNLKIS